MAADNCRGAIGYLDQHHFTEPMWYVMRSQADLLCWQERLCDTYKNAAFSDLEAGLRANPDSPRLLKEKAEFYADTHMMIMLATVARRILRRKVQVREMFDLGDDE
jgi:hypothetical protein